MKQRYSAMSRAALHYDELLKRYEELSAGIRMIRRAVEKARRSGVLPSGRVGTTPREDCEEIARVIYAAAARQAGRGIDQDGRETRLRGARTGVQVWSDG
jgi:hypothetical protein